MSAALSEFRRRGQGFAAGFSQTWQKHANSLFFVNFQHQKERHAYCKVMAERKNTAMKEVAMTLNLTPRLTIRIRKATDSARHVVHTQTRRLSITSLSFLKMEVMVFKYNVK